MNYFVVGYFFDYHRENIYFILKDKPHVPFLHKKLTGIGGKMETSDKTPKETFLREVREELSVDLEKEDISINSRGYFIDEYGHKVFIFTANLPFKLQQRYIDGEGWLVRKPIQYYKTHPNEFPLHNAEVLKKIIENPYENIEIDFSK